MVVDRKIQPVSSDVIEGSSPDMILKVKYPEYVTYVPVEIKCHDSEIKIIRTSEELLVSLLNNSKLWLG